MEAVWWFRAQQPRLFDSGGREIGKRGHEARQRLASTGIGHQKRVPPGVARRQHRRLMAANLPATSGKPGFDLRWYRRGHRSGCGAMRAVGQSRGGDPNPSR